MYAVRRQILEETFNIFRRCGSGHRECQAYWISDWGNPEEITSVVHPEHRSHAYGFQVSDQWLNRFWSDLADRNRGVRAQIHTHPGVAFHSPTDDAFPLLASEGFLSLVIPNFALGPIGFAGAFLTEIQGDGSWREVAVSRRIKML